jgi:sugar lactone lactonase YvrE
MTISASRSGPGASRVRAAVVSAGSGPLLVYLKWAWLVLAGLTWLLAVNPQRAEDADIASGLRVDVVATGVPRPIQLALDSGGRLVVLSAGWSGDSAGEVYRLDLHSGLPIDAARVPRVVIPFADESRKTVFGSLAVDPSSGDLLLGEENGNRIYRLRVDHRLQAVIVGLNHLLGGTSLTLDGRGRLIFLDYESFVTHLRSETPLPPSLSWLVEEGYRGPLVFRIDPHEDRPLPRRADLLIPILPRGETPRDDREPMWRLISVTAAQGDELVLLSSVGEVFRLGTDGELRLVVRLPAGHYHRTNLTTGPDGSIFVCAGYQIRQIFRISPAGNVSIVASELSDPGGIVVDSEGALYVPEAALHRIIRIAPNR